MTVTVLGPRKRAPRREATTQRFVLCPPDWFRIAYRINVWMDPSRRVDRHLAAAQWRQLRGVLAGLGHRLDRVDPQPRQPDQVFTRDPVIVCGNRRVLVARWRYPQRAGETDPMLAWLHRRGWRDQTMARAHIEGGDVLDAGAHGLLLGHGFRSDAAAAADLRAVSGRRVTTLRLVDPRFYHLDTALAVISPDLVAYYPPAFDAASRSLIRRRWPDAIRATSEDALALGLNLISDGRNVVMPAQAAHLAAALIHRGACVVGLDLSELAAAGGGPHCCVLPIPTSTEGDR